MALDLTIIDADGQPKHSMPMGWVTHDDLFRLAEAIGGFPLIARLSDYYQDARYEPEEVTQLLNEFQRLRREVTRALPPPKAELLAMIDGIAKLCEEALRERASIHAIAD